MLQFDGPARSLTSAQFPQPRRQDGTVPSRSLRALLFIILACSSVSLAQQGNAPKADPKASGKTAPAKPATNPIASLLKGKPVVPVSNQDLPAAIPEPPAPQSIPLPEVAARSQELSQKLRDLTSQLPTREQLDAMHTSLSELVPELQSKQKEVDLLLASTPNSLEVREQETYWRGMKTYTASWQEQLLAWAINSQAAIQKVDEQEPNWTATLQENQGVHDLDPVIALINSNLTEMRKLRTLAKEELQTIVAMQIQAGVDVEMAGDVLDRLAVARKQLSGHLLDRDSLPLWQVATRHQMGETHRNYGSVSDRLIAIRAFFHENAGAMVICVILLIVSQMLAYRLHVRVKSVRPEQDLDPMVGLILSHWLALGLLPPLMFGYLLVPNAPMALIGLAILISFVPILRLLPPFLDRRAKLMLYVLVAFSGFTAAIAWVPLSPTHKRELHFFANLVLFVFFAYILPRFSAARARGESFLRRLVLLGLWLAVAAVGISLLANLFGYVRLAQFLASASLYSAFIALSGFTAFRVFKVLFLAGMASPQAERIAAVRLHRAATTRWMPRIVAGIGVFIWLTATLDLLSLSESSVEVVNRLLNFHIAGSAAGITLGSVLGVFLILIVGYLAANVVRFGLREEVLKRFQLSRGLPELISSSLYYVILLLVFLSAVNVGGVELNKFTVLTGAIGVGFGFGLQNIINNFVSGLILQFERPVHIDDILEIDGNIGKVTRIGVRSSTIQTAQGAEVIIPNANFISSKVINWTLTESQRRLELPVGVAYGTDPTLVLRLLHDSASRHELVLTKPEPVAFFKGFGDSSLDFELQFWVMQENNTIKIKSEVGLVAMKLLKDAGIEIPFPQRDLNVRNIDPAAAALLASAQAVSVEEVETDPLPRGALVKGRITGD